MFGGRTDQSWSASASVPFQSERGMWTAYPQPSLA